MSITIFLFSIIIYNYFRTYRVQREKYNPPIISFPTGMNTVLRKKCALFGLLCSSNGETKPHKLPAENTDPQPQFWEQGNNTFLSLGLHKHLLFYF